MNTVLKEISYGIRISRAALVKIYILRITLFTFVYSFIGVILEKLIELFKFAVYRFFEPRQYVSTIPRLQPAQSLCTKHLSQASLNMYVLKIIAALGVVSALVSAANDTNIFRTFRGYGYHVEDVVELL